MPATKPETFVEYLRRVGSDVQASYVPPEETSPTAEDYQRAADTIEDLTRELARMVDAFERDDMSVYGITERRAVKSANRLLAWRVMGKKLT